MDVGKRSLQMKNSVRTELRRNREGLTRSDQTSVRNENLP